MSFVASLDQTALYKAMTAAMLRQTGHKESRIQPESIPTASQYKSPMLVFPAWEKGEELIVQSPVQSPQHAQTETDPFGEQLLMSFQNPTIASPPSPHFVGTATTATTVKFPGTPPVALQTTMESSETAFNSISSTCPGTSNMTPTSELPTSPSHPPHVADQSSKSGDHEINTATPTTDEPTPSSTILSLSSGEAHVQLLRDKIAQIMGDERALEEKLDTISRQKRDCDIEAVDRNKDLEATKAEIKSLQAKKREIETEVKQRKARQSELVHNMQCLETTANAKWREGRSVKRDIDEAARSRIGLEKQLRAAEFQEDLARQYPDAGLRKFIEQTTTNQKHSQLIYDIAQGQARDHDFDTIESLLEEAEDVTKSDIKFEPQHTLEELSESGAKSTAHIFLTITNSITGPSRAIEPRTTPSEARKRRIQN